MTDVLEVLLELECLKGDLLRHPLKGASALQCMKVLVLLLIIMDTIMKDTISKDCLAHLGMISSGDMTSTNT